MKSNLVENADADAQCATALVELVNLLRSRLGCDVLVIRIAKMYAALLEIGEPDTKENMRPFETIGSYGPGCAGVHTLTGDLLDSISAGDWGFAFYAGLPVRLTSGASVGTLIALGRESQTLAEYDLRELQKVSETVAEIVEARLTSAAPTRKLDC